jgi:hypothetical protein
MKLIYLPLLILLSLSKTTPADPIDKVAELMGKGNAHELAKLFASSIDISIADEENTYSKTQAEIILEKFFSENKPESSKVLHKVNSNANYHFGVVILNTDKRLYRVAFTLKDVGGEMQLIELRFETDKVK